MSKEIKKVIEMWNNKIKEEEKEYCFCGGALCMRCTRIDTLEECINDLTKFAKIKK